jgi:hypothetical protein
VTLKVLVAQLEKLMLMGAMRSCIEELNDCDERDLAKARANRVQVPLVKTCRPVRLRAASPKVWLASRALLARGSVTTLPSFTLASALGDVTSTRLAQQGGADAVTQAAPGVVLQRWMRMSGVLVDVNS